MLDSASQAAEPVKKRGPGRPRKVQPSPPLPAAGAPPEGDTIRFRDDLPPSQQARTSPRLSLPVGADGRLDLNSCRSETREKLKALLTDEELKKAILGEPDKPVEIFRPEETAILWDLIGQLEAMIAARMMKKVPREIIARVFPYSAREKQILAEPTAAVINKWCPVALANWKEEIQLFSTLVVIHKMKLDACKDLTDQYEKQKIEEAAAKVNGQAAMQAAVAAEAGRALENL